MTDWAGRAVETEQRKHPHLSPLQIAARLQLMEHRRAVRLVKQATKMVAADCYDRTDFKDGYMTAVGNILAMLQRGRTEGGGR